jgi:hypothetical protein
MKNIFYKSLLDPEEGLINQFEFIDSIENMKLVFACAQTEPIETARALQNAFSAKTVKELEAYVNGRGVMIQVLELLCRN